MCGIVGILGRGPVADTIVESLRRLEYRGYDSAGIATLEHGHLARRRAPGKLRALEALLAEQPLEGVIGIGHTRWATHGAPTERNAHPQATPRVGIVHNGIIENFRELKAELAAGGATFESDTDTEVVAQLIDRELAAGAAPAMAVAATLKRLRGAFALAIIFDGEPDLLVAARRGSPLALGLGDGENYIASDALALASVTSRIVYLEDGDWAVVRRSGVEIFDEHDRPVDRPVQIVAGAHAAVDRGNYRHFMAKEIHEQPEAIARTLGQYLDFATDGVTFPAALVDAIARQTRIVIVACGTASYAAQVGKYWLERLARLPVEVDVGSEFRYREPPVEPGQLTLFISQSGETADTLASLRYCRAAGATTAAIVNVATSSIAREAEIVLPTLAGPEIGVASTKAFTCQLAVLAALAIAAGKARGTLDRDAEARAARMLAETPRLVADALRIEPRVEAVARAIHRARDVLYIGRGLSYPLALEGALKLKEISYIHAEGYAAGELKHGPIALVDENVPVVVLAPSDRLFEKTASNVQEVAARGGRVILISDEAGVAAIGGDADQVLVMPEVPEEVAPIVYAVPVQLLAYHTAVVNGTDVDQPRNLAKSVTVE